VFHGEGGSAWPQGDGDAPGLLIGGNNDSGGPEDARADGNSSAAESKVVNGLRTRMRRPHASQN
jgi:hypothetical protein